MAKEFNLKDGEHNIYDQVNVVKKKAVGVVASALALITLLTFGVKLGKKNTKPEETNKIVYDLYDELIKYKDLNKDFDIEDKNAVNERANLIYELSEKEYTVDEIINAIYILNGRNDLFKFPENLKSDTDKFNYLQDRMMLLCGGILDDYLKEYVQHMDLEDKSNFKGNKGAVPCGYMFKATSSEAKDLLIDIARIYYTQRDDIANNNIIDYEKNANDYYALYEKAKDMELNDEDKLLIFKQISAIAPIFTKYLDDEKAKNIDEIQGLINNLQNSFFSNLAKDLDISEILDNVQNKGQCEDGITKLEDKYVPSDKNDAENVLDNNGIGGEIELETPVVVDKGGDTITNEDTTEIIETPSEESTWEEEITEEIPNSETETDEVIEEGGEVVEEVEVPHDLEDSDEVIEEGGEVVEEDNLNNTTETKPSSETKNDVDSNNIETDEVIEEGGEVVEEDVVYEENYEIEPTALDDYYINEIVDADSKLDNNFKFTDRDYYEIDKEDEILYAFSR